jgi:type IV secretion system protein VirB11
VQLFTGFAVASGENQQADRNSQGERTPAQLLEASLRMRPDRIIQGELRSEESRTFLEPINTEHGGSFTMTLLPNFYPA